MAIASCPECGGKVSTTVTSCPHCGYRPPVVAPRESTVGDGTIRAYSNAMVASLLFAAAGVALFLRGDDTTTYEGLTVAEYGLAACIVSSLSFVISGVLYWRHRRSHTESTPPE